MIVAELIASGELVNPHEMAESRGGAALPMRLGGLRLNPGLAVAPALLHEPSVVIRHIVAEDVEAEERRLHDAVAAMQQGIDQLVDATSGLGPGEHREILEAYRMFATDRGWLARMTEAVRSGLTAEAAVQKVRDETKSRLMQVTDPYLRERLYDLEDLANRLQQCLIGPPGGRPASPPRSRPNSSWSPRRWGRPSCWITRITASRASCSSKARRRCMSRSSRARSTFRLSAGSPARPVSSSRATSSSSTATTAACWSARAPTSGSRSRKRSRRAPGAAPITRRCATSRRVTRDGVAIELLLNAGLLLDVAQLDATGAAGIGLFRTEIQLLARNTFPNIAEQTAFYRRAFEQAGERPIVFRTLDIGGDKVLPYLPKTAEDNPAMGWRAIRIGLDRPAMLRRQLRALLRAAAGRELCVKFPMISEVAELDAARHLLDAERARLAAEDGEGPRSVSVGVMLEVPALLWQLPSLLQRVDFLSIGTNDLAQFIFACDRGNPLLAERYDLLSSPMLALLRHLVRECAAAGKPLSICGEMAGNPIEAMVLIALGFRRLSMAPTAIGPVKTMIRSLDAGALARYLDEIADRPDHSLRRWFEAYARDHAVAL